MAAIRIYLVTSKGRAPRLVEAAHPSNAVRFVAAKEFNVEVASQKDLVDLITRGTKVELIGAEQTELPTD